GILALSIEVAKWEILLLMRLISYGKGMNFMFNTLLYQLEKSADPEQWRFLKKYEKSLFLL
ncbi:hypothetical protein, partial [Prevotella bivia]